MQAAVGLLEGAGDVLGPGKQGGRGLFGAFGDLAVGVAEGRTGLLMQSAVTSRTFSRSAPATKTALFSSTLRTLSTPVESARSMVPARSSMMPVWRLNACSIFSTSAAIAAEMSRASGGDLVDVAGQRAVDILAGFGELAEIVFQRAGQHVAAFGQLADMAGNDVVDIAAAFGQLLQVGFQRALEDVAAFGQLLDLAGDQAVDAGAAFGQLGEIGFQGAPENVAAFGQLLDLAGDQAVDAGAAFGELGKIVFQRARQDVDALLGRALDLAGDEAVDASAALDQLVRGRLPARASGCRGLRRASRPGRRPGRRCWTGFRPACQIVFQRLRQGRSDPATSCSACVC